MSDADCTPGREPRSVAASFSCGCYLLLFLAYSQRSQIGRLPYVRTWCGLSANLEYLSEMCCKQLVGNTRRKNSPQIRHLRTISQSCRAICSQLWHISTVRKMVKQQYLLHISSQYSEFRPTNSWHRLTSLGHSSKFKQVSGLCFVTAPTSLNGGQPNFARCLAVSWAGKLCIYFCVLLTVP